MCFDIPHYCCLSAFPCFELTCLIAYFQNYFLEALTSIYRVDSKQTNFRNDRSLKLHCHVTDILLSFAISLFLLNGM